MTDWKLLKQGVPVVWPSGIEVRHRPVDISMLSAYGHIPDALTSFVKLFMTEGDPLATFQSAVGIHQSLHLLARAEAMEGFSYAQFGVFLQKVEDEELRRVAKQPVTSREVQLIQTLITQLLALSENYASVEALREALRLREQSLPKVEASLTEMLAASRKWYERYVLQSVVYPHLIADEDGGRLDESELADDQLPVRYISLEDLQFEYGFVNQPLHELIRFSEEQSRRLAALFTEQGGVPVGEPGDGGESAGDAADGVQG